MASGAPVVEVLDVIPPAATFATLTTVAGGSTPAEAIRAWRFVDASTTYLDFLCRLKGYAGGGLTLTLHWSALAAITGAVRWGAAIRRIADDAEDVDTAHTYDFNLVTATAPSAAIEVDYAAIAFTDGADMDSWADGELAIIRVQRVGADAADTLGEGCDLWAISGAET